MEIAWCRGDPAAEYSRKLEYLKREEELIKEEELEAEAILQPSGESLQVSHHQLALHHLCHVSLSAVGVVVLQAFHSACHCSTFSPQQLSGRYPFV